jgi:hypothetical protein
VPIRSTGGPLPVGVVTPVAEAWKVSAAGQHLVKEPTEQGGTRRYSRDIANRLRPAKALVAEVDATSLTRKKSEVQIL